MANKSFTQMGYIAYVLFVVWTVLAGFAIIPLAWFIPMLLHYKHAAGKVGTGFKVCTILFCGLVPGILMLCDTKNNNTNIKTKK